MEKLKSFLKQLINKDVILREVFDIFELFKTMFLNDKTKFM